MKPKTLAILAVLALLAVIAAALVLRAGNPSATDTAHASPTAAPLFADLPARINDVAAISVRTASAQSTIELSDGQWRLREKASFPVDAAKAREVILSLAALRNFEPRTARPEGYKALGVEDVPASAAPAKPDADPAEAPRSILVTLKDKSGQPLTSVIVGNTRWPSSSGIAGSAGVQGVYLRKPDDPQSYFAEGKLDIPREPLSWLNTEFADIARDRVRSVTLAPADAQSAEADRIVVARDRPDGGAFTVQNVPPGKQLNDTSLSEVLVSGLVKTTFEDVAPADTINFAGADDGSATPGPTALVRTWDGLLVSVQTVKVGERHWWKLSAAPDPDPWLETPPAPPAPAPAAEGAQPPPPPPAPEPRPRRTPEEVRKEVDELNARWSPWAFSPFSYKASAFTRRLSQELKDVPPPAPPPTPAPDAPSSNPPAPAVEPAPGHDED